jgi:hypothetical protein
MRCHADLASPALRRIFAVIPTIGFFRKPRAERLSTVCKNPVAPFFGTRVVDELHSIENTRDKSARFSLTKNMGGVKTQSFFDISNVFPIGGASGARASGHRPKARADASGVRLSLALLPSRGVTASTPPRMGWASRLRGCDNPQHGRRARQGSIATCWLRRTRDKSKAR